MATSYAYAPLSRSSVGFDRISNLLENAQRARSISEWPPYEIGKTGEESYRISIAVAGFAQDDLEVTFQSNLLVVSGNKQNGESDGYLHRGIAGRPFEGRFGHLNGEIKRRTKVVRIFQTMTRSSGSSAHCFSNG